MFQKQALYQSSPGFADSRHMKLDSINATANSLSREAGLTRCIWSNTLPVPPIEIVHSQLIYFTPQADSVAKRTAG
jgi:hypothetical protein